jgi:hypothetical protein
MHTHDDSPSFGEDESDERTPSLGEGESDEHDHDCHILQPQENASCGVELSTSYPEQEATAWGDVEDYGQWKNLDECDPKWFAKVCVFACILLLTCWVSILLSATLSGLPRYVFLRGMGVCVW